MKYFYNNQLKSYFIGIAHRFLGKKDIDFVMKSKRRGKDISASVENITPFGIWLYVKEKEYFLSYADYPYFKDHTLNSIQNVQLLHNCHLYWPELDVDLEIDNLENPQKYPLKFQSKKHPAGRRAIA